MTLRFALLALAITLSPVVLSAAVQYSAPVSQTVGTAPRLPRKKSFFPNEHARRYHYLQLRRDTGAAARFVLLAILIGLVLYGLLYYLIYAGEGGIYGWTWGVLLSAIGGVVIGVIVVMIIRWLMFWLSGLVFRLRVPAFRRRYRRCPVR
ncbi:MAG TPA: hypothetical protein PK198_24435 [Saprospiraceae bacterium]|nr:hypothetical protein [Saprospiraceae bacterium]HRK82012.1 hypothetical protein [Saprospiraceae bacterium]